MKLYFKLILAFILTSIIPIVLISFFVFNTAKSNIETTILNQLNVVADLKVDKINSFFSERRSDIATAQHYLNIKNNLPILSENINDQNSDEYKEAKQALDSQLQVFQEVHQYNDVMLVDDEGVVVYTSADNVSTHQLNKLLDDPDSIAFEEGKKGIFFTRILKSHSEEGQFEMLATAPIYDLEDNFIGEIVLEINMNLIYEFIQDTTGLGETGETLIGRHMLAHEGMLNDHMSKLSGDHALFLNPLRHDPNAAFTMAVPLEADYALPIIDAVQGGDGSSMSIDYRGVETLAAWRNIPGVEWGLVAKIDVTEAFSLITELRNIALMIGSGSIILVLILSFYIANSIASPIEQLTLLVSKVSKGKYDVNLDEIASKDEIGTLVEKFKEMIAFLRDSEKEQYDFITSASHQLRTPASGVRMQLGLLLEQLSKSKSTSKEAEIVREILSNNSRVISIVNDLLMLLELGDNYEASNLNKVGVREIIDEVVKSLDSEIEMGEIKVTINIPKGLEFNIEEYWMKITLQHLIENAVVYSKKKGTVLIEAVQKGEKVRINIIDDGLGIPSKEQLKIFSKFFRAKNSYLKESVGSGLGLVMSKIIIEGHGGTLGFESQENKGSTFWFELSNNIQIENSVSEEIESKDNQEEEKVEIKDQSDKKLQELSSKKMKVTVEDL
jgi:signal transduction histidine kinase